MNNKLYYGVMVVLLILVAPVITWAQGEQEEQGAQGSEPKAISDTKYGVGFQGTFPASGISGMIDLTDAITAQAIIGFYGNLKTYAGRGLYRFRKENFWNLYGYGMVGAWSYSLVGESETVPGFGAGAGIEYDWRGWNPELPSISWNLELGLGVVNFDKVNYNFSTLLIGAGVHYRF